MPAEEYTEIGLPGYVRILLRRKSTFLVTLLAVILLGVIYILFTTPVYESKSQLLVERSGPKVLSIEEVYSIDSGQKDYYRTQCEMIVSRTVLNRVIRKLKLDGRPPFSQARDPVLALRKMIRAQPIRDSRLITVNVLGQDPEEITRINHALIDIYIQQQLEDKLGVSENAGDWLSGQIEPLRDKLEASEVRVREFLEEEGISSIEEAKALVNQKILSVNKSLIEARKERMAIEAEYQRLKETLDSGGDIFTLPAVARDELIKELKGEKIKLDREATKLAEIYRPGHPEMRRLQDQIGFLQEEMISQVRSIIEITKRDYEGVKERENDLEELLENLNREASRLNELTVTFTILERDVKSNRKLYEAVVDRLKETDVIDELTSSGVRVVDRAEVPRIPIKPRKRMILLFSLVIGLFGGLGLAVYRESIDTSFRSLEDAEQYLGLSALGRIPYLRNKRNNIIALDLISHTEPRSLASESFRHIRTYLESVAAQKGITSFLITSSSPQEGKTDVAINIAITLSEAGRKVLLLDADMRRPRLHKTFRLDPAPGFKELLEGEAAVGAVIRPTEINNLSVIPCGNYPTRPSELLEASDLASLLEQLRERFDYVLLDSPPVVPVTDALILAEAVDGIIQVVQGDKTKREVALAAKNRLAQCRGQLMGMVLAQIKSAPRRYYTSYYGY